MHVEAFVVIVDGDREDFLGAVLANNILIESLLDLAWSGNSRSIVGTANPTPLFLVDDRLT
jgi:hypothetical protein